MRSAIPLSIYSVKVKKADEIEHDRIGYWNERAYQYLQFRSSSDHESALKRIHALMSAKPGTDDGDELDVLAALVDTYETEHFPIDLPDPIDAIKFRMEQTDLD